MTASRVAVTASAVHLPPGDAEEPACDAAHAADLLGRKGLLAKEPATRLALCAVHRAFGRPAKAPRPSGLPDPETAVVVSSNLGNVGTVSEIARQVRHGGVRAVSPLEAPNASSNVIASTVAIWFRFGGPNLTVCSGATAGLDAVSLGGLLLRAGRAKRVVVVGCEPDDADAARIHAMRRGAEADLPLRAVAACVVLGPPDAAAPLAFLEFTAEPAAAGDEDIGSGAIGDWYGAAGVVRVALAVAAAAGDPDGYRRRVVCGDRADGWRALWVAGRSRT